MFRYRILALLMVVVTLTFTLVPGHASAAEDKKEKPPSIDVVTGKVLNKAIDFLNKQQYDQAIGVLSKLKLDKLSPYVRSKVEQIYANIDSNRGNYKGAREHFQKAIDAGGLNEVDIDRIRYVIAHLYMVEGDWRRGAEALEQWFRTTKTKPNAGAYYLLAVAYYQLKEYEKSLTAAKKAVSISEKPSENRLQLVLALQLQLQRYAASIPTLGKLIELDSSNKTYWVQLSSIYAEMQDYADATAVMQVAYDGGILKDDPDYRRLASLLMYTSIPYRAGEILAKELKNGNVKGDSKAYEALANAWIAARDYRQSITPLEKAAEESKDGDLFMRLGQVHVQLSQWQEASDAFKSAIDKGGLDDPGNAYEMMGISMYNLKKLPEARGWFEKALHYKKHRKTAEGYIKLIDSKIKVKQG